MNSEETVTIFRRVLTELVNNPAAALRIANTLAMDDEIEIIVDEIIAARIRKDLKGFIDELEKLEQSESPDQEKVLLYREQIRILSEAYEYFKILPEPQERYHNYLQRMEKQYGGSL